MGHSAASLLFGFDRFEGVAKGYVWAPTSLEQSAPRFGNLDAAVCTAPLLTEYLIANRGRLGLKLRLASTERAAASAAPWFYELAIHNEDAERAYFTAPGGFWEMLPARVRTGLQRGTARLLISNLIEGTTLSPLRHLYSYLDAVGVRPSRVGYFCGSTNLASLHESFCCEQGVLERIHVAGISFWEDRTYADFLLHAGEYHVREGRVASVDQFASLARAAGEQSFAFLCLNGKGRYHRWALLGLLAARGLLEHGLVSFRAHDFEDTEWWPDGPLGVEAHAGVAAVRGRVPLSADDAMDRPTVGACFSSHLYLESALSVVAETLYAGEPVHFCSEKTFRPILHLHPFVLLGPPGMLRSLRASGYQTFHPLLDEAYDEMEDPTARLGAVVGEVERLGRMDRAERGRWHRRLYDRLEHNLCRLLSQRSQLPDVYDEQLVAALAALQRASPPGPQPVVDATPTTAASSRLRLTELLPGWPPASATVGGDPRLARKIARRLWRWTPATFARSKLEPVRALLTAQALELDLASGRTVTTVHIGPSAQYDQAYCRTSQLAIFYSGELPYPRFPLVLDRLAARLGPMDFESLCALCRECADGR